METAELVEIVKAHARANYETGGWDYIIETYEDDQIAELIAGATTGEEAIAKAAEEVGLLDDRRQDIRAEIF